MTKSNATSTNKRRSSSIHTTTTKRAKTNPGPSNSVQITKRVDPRKSPFDPNHYRVITLSNGLTVALISRQNAQNVGVRSECSQENLDLHDPSCPFMVYPSSPDQEDDEGDFSINSVNNDTSIINQRERQPSHNVTSVALTVNVGSLNDPVDCQGLAHFTEHMVHYGTAKFPQPDAIKVVLVNFGTFNAYTKQHSTVYFHQVPDIVSDHSLEQLADMLVAPTFEQSMLNREINAIDNEFFLKLHFRKIRLLQIHVGIEGNLHPLTRFSTGNLTTLTKALNRNTMKKHHEKNYVTSAMTLSLNSSKSLDQLEELTLRHFSSFPKAGSNDRKTLIKTTGENEFPRLRRNRFVYMQGWTDQTYLSLWWWLPADLGKNNRKDRALSMIVRMLSDTSPNSLISQLQNQELVFVMYKSYSSNRYASMVEVVYGLTPTGAQRVERIVRLTLSYIGYLQQNERETEMKRLFEEMRVQSLREYHFGSQMTSLETTMDFSTRLQYIGDVEELVTSKSWLDSTFQFKNIKSALEKMNVDSMTLIKLYPKDTVLEGMGKVNVAPISGAKYVEVAWPTTQRPNNRGSGDADTLGDETAGVPAFEFVPENPYLQQDIKRLRTAVRHEDITNYLRVPENCGDITRQELSCKQQSLKRQLFTFGRSKHDPTHGQNFTPKIRGYHLGHSEASLNPFSCDIFIQFVSPLLTKNTYSRALSALWGQVILLRIHSFSSHFATAGFCVRIFPDQENGMFLGFNGFPEHIIDVVHQVVEQMFHGPITQTMFSLAKHLSVEILENRFSDNAFITRSLLHCTAFLDSEPSIDIVRILKDITFRNLENFVEAFKRFTVCQVWMKGNLPLQGFEELALLLDNMPFSPEINNDPALYSNNILSVNPNMYKPGETCIRVQNMFSCAYTTTVRNFYTVGPLNTDQSEAHYFAAAMYFMRNAAFMELRNRQQLAYVVHVQKINYDWLIVPLMMFTVTITATASKHTACELDQKIDQFLAEYGDYLIGMREDIFNTMLKLTATPSTVTKAAVGEWFKKKFNADFGQREIEWKCARRLMRKQSIQVFSVNENAKPKLCNCDICETLTQTNDWVPGWNRGSHQLLFARGRGHTRDYFVTPLKF